MLISLLCILVCSSGFSSDTTSFSRSAKALSSQYKDGQFTALLLEGFHFNEQAPNIIDIDGKSTKPADINPRKIEFKVSHLGLNNTATLYVCDNALTYCETHHIAVQNFAKKNIKTINSAKSSVGINHFQKALQNAKAKKLPLLLEFSARWCPGCVRYENEVFTKPEFKKLTKNFVTFKVDVDLYDNFNLSDKYAIKGIPTIVIVNPEGKEIARISDYQPFKNLKTFLSSVEKNPTPIANLLLDKHGYDSVKLMKVAKRLLASQQYAAAIEYLNKIKPATPELLSAQVELAKENYENNKANKNVYEKVLKDVLDKEPNSLRSFEWRTELVQLLDSKLQAKEIEKLASEGEKLANSLSSSPTQLKIAVATDDVGEFLGYEKLLVYFYLVDLYDAAGRDTSSAWNTAAEVGAAYKIPIVKQGPSLRYLIVLTEAKKYSEAENLADAMLKFNPSNQDIKRRKLKILMAQNKYKEAATLGEQIINKADGRTQFWIAEILAKAYLADQRKEDSKNILKTYLSRQEITSKHLESVKKDMEELLKTMD